MIWQEVVLLIILFLFKTYLLIDLRGMVGGVDCWTRDE